MARCRRIVSLAVALALPVAALAAAGGPEGTQPEGPISGRVLNAQGKPAVGVTVTFFVHRWNGVGGFRSVRSGPDGSFSFPAPGKDPKHGMTLLASTERSGHGSLGISPSDPRSGITLRLEDASATISGRVLDASERPIAGVTARLLQVRVGERGIWFPDEVRAPQAVTDALGRYRLSGLPKDAQVGFRFLHPRYARYENWRHWRSVTAGQSGKEAVPVRLRPAARIEGRVLYSGTGKPAAGARVRTWQDLGPDPNYHASAEAVTDRSGRFRIEQLPPGRYRVSLQGGPHAGQWVARSRRVDNVTAGKTATCEPLTLVRGGIAPGVVTDRDTGAPLEGAYVNAFRSGPQGHEDGPSATTGKDGRFRLRLPAGPWNLRVWHPRCVEPWMGGGDDTTPVTVPDGKSAAETRHTLARYATLPVRVFGPDGQPDPRATLAVPMSGEIRMRPDGTATLDRLRPGATTTIIAVGGDRALKALVEPEIQKGENPPLTIRLARGLPVTGRVTDGQGRPMADVEVEARRRVSLGTSSWTDSKVDGTRTGADGRFSLWLLPGEEHTVQTSLEGYSRARKPNVILKEGTLDLGALAIRRADRVIAGRVTDVYGDPVAGVRISCYSQEQPDFRQTVTDEKGRYRLTGLVVGRVNVNLEQPPTGFESRNNVPTGSTGVDFVLAPREEARPRATLKPGDRAPTLATARWLNGGVKPGALKGRVLLIQFATPYNAAVEASAARLRDLHRRYAARGVSVLALYDASLPEGELAAYVKARGLSYPVATVPARNLGWTSEPFRRFGVHSVPSLYLIDRRGFVRAVNPTAEALEQEVRRLVQ